MAAASIERASFPSELTASVSIEQMRPAPFERVAATLVERWSMLTSNSTSVDGPVPVQVEDLGTTCVEPVPAEAERVAAIPVNVPMPPVRLRNAQAERIAAIPIEQLPLPHARFASIAPEPEQKSAIPLDHVPLPRARLVSIAPEPPQMAAIPSENIPLPHQRPASISAVQVASLVPLDHVPLPRARASVVPETALIPSGDVQLPRARLATCSPEAPTAAHEPVGGRQFMAVRRSPIARLRRKSRPCECRTSRSCRITPLTGGVSGTASPRLSNGRPARSRTPSRPWARCSARPASTSRTAATGASLSRY